MDIRGLPLAIIIGALIIAIAVAVAFYYGTSAVKSQASLVIGNAIAKVTNNNGTWTVTELRIPVKNVGDQPVTVEEVNYHDQTVSVNATIAPNTSTVLSVALTYALPSEPLPTQTDSAILVLNNGQTIPVTVQFVKG